ncbi:MAG: TRAP transporter substrate-binding protein DctP [Chloroflexota bacterium]
MKKVLLICLALVLGVTLILVGCGQKAAPAPGPAPSAPAAPAPAPAPAPQKYEFIYTDHAPPMAGGNVLMHEWYLPRLKEMLGPMGNQVEFTWYHASSLFPYQDQINAVEQGLADICTWVNSWEIERAPLNDVMSLPFMGFQSSGIGTQAWEALNITVPEVAAEWKGFEVLGRWNGLKRYIGTNAGTLRTPADYKGHKIIASGIIGEIVQSFGGAALQLAPADWYTSLDRGLADSLIVGMSMYPMFKLTEVLDYAVAFPSGDFGYTGTNWVMGEKKFKSLPIEMQGAFRALRPQFIAQMVAVDARETAKGIQAFIDSGGKLETLTAAEEQAWFDVAIPFHEKWIAGNEAKGRPGKKVYDAIKNWIGIYRQGLATQGIGG